MNRRAVLLLGVMSVLWGIPYLFIKLAVDELSPPVVVASRTLVAAVLLVPMALASGAMGRLRRHYPVILLLSLVHVVGPFLLITYGEVFLASGLTALLLATQPLIIAALALRFDASERVGGWRLAGLGVGLVGVAAVVGFDIGVDDRDGLLGAGMVLLAGAGYALATFLVKRKLSGVPPLGVAAGTMIVSTVLLLPFAVVTAPSVMPSVTAGASVVVLGLLSTALALVLYYRLIAVAGAGSASLVAYTCPAVAVLLGVTVLGEPLTVFTVLGFALIIAGSWLSARHPASPASPASPATPATGASPATRVSPATGASPASPLDDSLAEIVAAHRDR